MALIAAGSIYVGLKGIKIDTNFLSVFPKHEDLGHFYKASALFEKKLEEEILFFVSAADGALAVTAADELADEMFKSPIFSQVQIKFQGPEQDRWISFLHEHRKSLLTVKTIRRVQDGATAQILEEALRAAYSPTGVTGNLSSDPLNLFQDFILSSGSAFSLKPENGYLLSRQGDAVAVFLRAKINPSASNFNSKLVEFYETTKSTFSKKNILVNGFGGSLYSAFGSEKSMQEVSLYGTLSFAAVLGLLIWCFASILPVVVGGLTILISLLAGLTLVVMVFSSVHILSLLLGVSILGVVTDYCTHFFAKGFDDNLQSSDQVIKKISAALGIGFLTNMLTYLCFYFTDLVVLQQLSLFTMMGVFTTYVTVMAVYPLLPFQRQNAQRFLWIQKISSAWKFQSPGKVLAILSFLVVAGFLSASGLKFDDDVRKLQKPKAELKADEDRVLSLVGASKSAAYFLVRGQNPEEVLIREESLAERLSENNFKSFGVSRFAPSQERQEVSQKAYDGLKAAVRQFYKKIGAVIPAEMKKFLAEPTVKYGPDEFLKYSGSLPVAANWLGEIDGEYYSVVNIIGPAEYQNLVPFQSESVHLRSKSIDLTLFLKELRQHLIVAFSAVIVLLGLFLGFVYRGKKALFVLGPPVLSAAATLVIAMWIYGSLNLFHVLAVILIFCLGLDYSVFFSQSKNSELATHIGIFISMLSTIGSFGVLALSKTHAVSSFGVSVFIGIGLCYLLAPLAAGGESVESLH